MHATGTEKKLKIKKIVIILISALILVSITGIISYRIGCESKVKVTFTETEIPDKSRTVYVTPHGKRYHKGSCDYVKGKGTPLTTQKAKQKGYTPCKVCKP